MKSDIRKGDTVVCIDRPPKSLLTIGRRYLVEGDNRGDGVYPSVKNDDGRLTQYHCRWFQRDMQP